MSKANNISQGKAHYQALFKLGIPIVIGQLGIIVLGFADTFMIGHHDTLELGASSFVNNVFNLGIIFSTGFSYGLTPVVGELCGSRNFASAGQALKASLLANFLVGLLVTAVFFILYLNVTRLGQPIELMPLIRPYYLVLLVSMVFIMLFNAFKQFADGITDTKTAMWILLGGNSLNILGNYLLIYGKWGFPELGLLGAGISTLTSRIVMLLVFIWVFAMHKRYRRYFVGFSRFPMLRKDFYRLNALGWPLGLQMGMETASFNFSAIMMGWIGAYALAAHQVMCTISTLAFLVYYGMGAAIAVRVSYFRGQHDWVNVRRVTYAGLHIIWGMALFFCILLFLLRNHMAAWFTDSQEVSVIVASLVLPMLLYQFGDGMQIAFANALRGISDVKPMMWIAFVAYFIISLPAGYFFGFVLHWGAPGVWMALPFGLSSAGIMFWLRFRRHAESKE
ncbi:MATE family efflux transporter [uncultured Bacteroides sp.]|uniref:MATE family efflux transporter n=1 Tax=uncultured Bacteroides sp. TaxID=162156 RepID=UPI002AAB2F13|nr:MATE family efflux transporter [uncultured Bacteroides sp.]